MNIFVYNRFNKIGKDVSDMRETRTLEFKETITNTFLKTVSAFFLSIPRITMEELFSLELMTMERSKGWQMLSNHVWILKIK